jgi:hypothetical protein
MLAPRSLLSREAQVLTLLAGGESDDAAARQLLGSELNWLKLGVLAEGERATPIVWQWLQRVHAPSMPVELTTAWRRAAMVSEFQLLRLERRLHDVIGALGREGIEVMLLKGSALAYTAYGCFTNRPMGDLDLLVRPERAQGAWRLLQTLGWVWPSARWPARHYARHQHLPPLVDSSEEGLRLELHTDLFPRPHPFQLPAEALWRAATTLSVGGHSVLVPDPVHQLLHLCVHFTWSHMMQWGSWRTFRDVAALTREGHVDWARLEDLARNGHAATCCFWTLRLARNLCGARVPDDVLRALRPPLPPFLLDRLERHYVLQLFAADARCPSAMLGRCLWECGILPRWSKHGAARPWDVDETWIAPSNGPTASTSWLRWLMNWARQVGDSVRYLARTIAAPRPPELNVAP